MSYDDFKDKVQYVKSEIQTQYDDCREFNFSDIVDDEYMEFVEASKIGNDYVIKYEMPTICNLLVEFSIKDNKIDIVYSHLRDTDDEILTTATTTYTYYDVKTNQIPSIPNVNWEDGGIYIIE